jgi:hypothetical protein
MWPHVCSWHDSDVRIASGAFARTRAIEMRCALPRPALEARSDRPPGETCAPVVRREERLPHHFIPRRGSGSQPVIREYRIPFRFGGGPVLACNIIAPSSVLA